MTAFASPRGAWRAFILALAFAAGTAQGSLLFGAVGLANDQYARPVADTEIETDLRIALVKFAKMWDNHKVRKDTGHFHAQPAGWLHLRAGHAAVKFFYFR